MCATACPNGALAFGTIGQMRVERSRSEPLNRFRFGSQEITIRVLMMVLRGRVIEQVDVTAAWTK